jgi:hypothetical protein
MKPGQKTVAPLSPVEKEVGLSFQRDVWNDGIGTQDGGSMDRLIRLGYWPPVHADRT